MVRGRSDWVVVAAAALLVFMAQLDTTIVNVALPRIQAHFSADAAAMGWLVVAFPLPLIALTLLAGRWLDLVDLRAALVVSTTAFAGASVAAGLAPGVGWLIVARAIQGATAAVLLAIAPVLAVGAASDAPGRALALVATLGPVGAMCGPVLGGALVGAAGWSSIFFVNIPIAAVVAFVARTRMLQVGTLRTPPREWVVESALIGAVCVAVLLGLWLPVQRSQAGWGLVAVLALPPLIWLRRRPSARLIGALLRLPGVGAVHVAFAASYTSLFVVQFLAPFFLDQRLQLPSSAIGLVLAALPAAAAAVGPVSGWLVDLTDERRVAVAGAACLMVGTLLVVPLSPTWGSLDVAWRLVLVGAGFGLLTTPIQAAALAAAPAHLVATTAATTNLARHVGIALGPALATLAWSVDGGSPAAMSGALVVGVAAAAATVASALAMSPRRYRAADLARRARCGGHPILRHTPTPEGAHLMSTRVAVIYYSATGNVHALALAVAEGARETGADVRVRRVPELAPEAAIDSNPAWRAHVDEVRDDPVATHEDLRWADAMALGTPARFGNVAAQLKQFIDTTGPLWAEGVMADKTVTAFTSAINRHGGNETTLLALYNTMYHWGAVIVPPGYTDESTSFAGGNPYGTAHVSGDGAPSAETLAAARYQGRRLAVMSGALRQVRQPT